MTSFYDSHDYYKKMLGLQEQLRKSEEKRIRLEERFKILVQESRNRHDARINRLRMRYIELLEEQRTRDERNHKLLDALDKVDNSLASMTAKTNRLNVLRKQYDAYLRRIYASHSPPGSVVGDNDATKQNEDWYSRRTVAVGQIDSPSKVRNVLSQVPQSNRHTNLPLPKPMQNVYYDNTVHPKMLNRQLKDSQSALQLHSMIPRNNIEQLPFQAPSTSVYQQKQPYSSNNVHFQVNPSFYIPYPSSNLQISSSSQAIPRFNESSVHQMGMVQPSSRLQTSDRINGNAYKSVDEPQNRATASYIDSSMATESFRQQNTEALPASLHTCLKNDNELSSIFRATPTNTERNTLGASLSSTPRNMSKPLLPSHLTYSSRSAELSQKSVTDVPLGSLLDDSTRRHERFAPKRLLNSARASRLSMGIKQALAQVDEGRATTTIIENELDRYIDKIRKLHRDLDDDSLEEMCHERNTSGDAFGETLLDSDPKPRVEDKPLEKLPKEVENVLALADDLANRTVNLNDAKGPEEEGSDENRSLDRPVSAENPVPVSGNREGRAAYAKDKISGGIALHRPELDPHQNVGEPQERNFTGLMKQHEQQLPRILVDECVESAVSSTVITERDSEDTVIENARGKEHREGNNIRVAEESKLEQYAFDIVQELEPWRLDDVEKEIKEMDLSDIEAQAEEKESNVDEFQSNRDNSEEVESPKETNIVESTEGKLEATKVEEIDSNDSRNQMQLDSIERLELEESTVDKSEIETSEVTSQSQRSEREDDLNDEKMQQSAEIADNRSDKQEDNEEKGEYNEDNRAFDVDQNTEQEITMQSEKDVEESDRTPEYAHRIKEETSIDQKVSYESDQNQEYQVDGDRKSVEGSSEQSDHASIPRNQGPNTQHQEDLDQQYTNISEDKYKQDPNVQYQEDPNSQVHKTDVNEPHEHAETYAHNQPEIMQEQEDKMKQAQREEHIEIKEEARETVMEETTEKFETDQSRNEKLAPRNESKKKKDVIKSLFDSDTDSTIERNVSNTESDFDFN